MVRLDLSVKLSVITDVKQYLAFAYLSIGCKDNQRGWQRFYCASIELDTDPTPHTSSVFYCLT